MQGVEIKFVTLPLREGRKIRVGESSFCVEFTGNFSGWGGNTDRKSPS
jgi:hypothetical protein